MLTVLTVHKGQGKAPCPREGSSLFLLPKLLPGGLGPRGWGGLGTHCKGSLPFLPLPPGALSRTTELPGKPVP